LGIVFRLVIGVKPTTIAKVRPPSHWLIPYQAFEAADLEQALSGNEIKVHLNCGSMAGIALTGVGGFHLLRPYPIFVVHYTSVFSTPIPHFYLASRRHVMIHECAYEIDWFSP